MSRLGNEMFGVKLVGAVHPAYDFFGRKGTPTLMNFPDSPEGRRIGACIPIGHKSLVYLMHPVMRIWSTVEYVKWDTSIPNVLEEGTKAAIAQRAIALIEARNRTYARVWRCVRLIAIIDDPSDAPPPDFDFHEGEIMRDLTEQDYLKYFNAIPWSWTA